MDTAKQYCHPVVKPVGGLQSQLSAGFITVILFKPLIELAGGKGGGGRNWVNNIGKKDI